MAREGPYLISTAHPCQRLGEEFLHARAPRPRLACRKTAPIATHTRPAGTSAKAHCLRCTGRSGTAAVGSTPGARGPERSRARPDAAFAGAGERGGTTRGMDTRRHAPLGRRRVHLGHSQPHTRSHAYLGRTRRPLGDIYVSDHADTRQGGRFRWLVSTCLAAAVGVLAILVVIAGSTDTPGDGRRHAVRACSACATRRSPPSGCPRRASTGCAGRSPRPTGC